MKILVCTRHFLHSAPTLVTLCCFQIIRFSRLFAHYFFSSSPHFSSLPQCHKQVNNGSKKGNSSFSKPKYHILEIQKKEKKGGNYVSK